MATSKYNTRKNTPDAKVASRLKRQSRALKYNKPDDRSLESVAREVGARYTVAS